MKVSPSPAPGTSPSPSPSPSPAGAPAHVYNIGDLVDIIESGEVVMGAKIIAIQASDGPMMETSVELEYDKGGSGWWPVSSIKPQVCAT